MTRRLIEGDCMTEMIGLEPESFDAVITDPPYGVDFQSSRRTESQRLDKIANDTQPFVWWLYHAYRLTKEGGCLICFCRWDTAEAFRLAIEWAGYDGITQLIWDREVHGMGDLTGRPSPRHDNIWFAAKGKYKLPGKRPSSVYRSQRLGGEALVHPNQKPVSLMRQLVRDFVPRGGTVLEPFAGSGSTMTACAVEGRSVVGIELDPNYCAAIRESLPAEGGGGVSDTVNSWV